MGSRPGVSQGPDRSLRGGRQPQPERRIAVFRLGRAAALMNNVLCRAGNASSDRLVAPPLQCRVAACAWSGDKTVMPLSAGAFYREQRGSVALVFAVCTCVLVMALGLAVDVGRAMHTRAKIVSAADAAVLAAGRKMHDPQLSTSDLAALARRFFEANMGGQQPSFGAIREFAVAIDRDRNTVSLAVTAEVPTTFARVGGVASVSIPITAAAAFDPLDIEVSLSLDLTGSMCNPCSKIEDLKVAARDLVDILLPAGKATANKVRIALAPFAAGVNAGSFAGLATDNRSEDGCAFERDGSARATDAAPGTGAFLKVAGDAGVARTRDNCPDGAPVVALTNDAGHLRQAIAALRTGGSTAGHLGTAWAWYLLSPAWQAIWPAASAPAAYKDGKTIKAVILMTDGVYNTFGGACDRACSNVSAQARDSQDLARDLCRGMREQGVVVYSVGFMLDDASAEDVLRECAGSRFYRAEDRAALRRAFSDIAHDLMQLRLAR
jgi:Flp pilus assembly protein TadG